MRTKLKQRFLGFALLMVFGGSQAHAETRHTSAHFAVADKSLHDLIEFPSGEQDVSLVVLCNTLVTRTGRLRDTMCNMRDATTRPYERAIRNAAKRARAVPGTVDGQATQVWAQFAVFFERAQTVESVTVFPHNFLQSELFGADYIAPQRHGFPRFPDCELKHPVWIAYSVDRVGRATILAFERGDNELVCVESFKQRVLDSKYIPAFSRGRAVDANVIEPFWSGTFLL
jgi:hypothetical protein